MPDKNHVIRPWQSIYEDRPNDSNLRLPPRIIYKYTSLSRAKEIIESQKLWFSCPNSFNDPFDMYHGLIDFSMNKTRAKIFANKVRANHPRSVRRFYAKDLLKRKDELVNHQVDLFEETKRNSGVCCFSESADIALMWSHYADSHRGVVLGFNIDPAYMGLGMGSSMNDIFFITQHVKYANKVEPLNFYDYKDKALVHWIFTKSGIWSYEKEIRAFYRNENGLIPYSPKCLKEIHFGCNTTNHSIKEIRDLVPEDVILKMKTINSKRFDIDTIPLKI